MSTLKLNREQQVKLPVGGEFVSGPLIGKWIAAVLYKFLTEGKDMAMFSGFDCDAKRTQGDWNIYYFSDYEQAKHWNEQAKNKYAPNGVWAVQASRDDILNITDEGREKWDQVVVFDHCSVVTPQSKKYRHELHMISLPCAVSAYARANGWDVPEFDVHELVDPNTQFTDDFQEYMVGSPDAKTDDYKDFQVAHDLAMNKFGENAAEVVRRLVLGMPTDDYPDIPEPVIIEAKSVKHIHYQWSVLWERRAALWKLLGCDDPLPYRPYGTAEEEGKARNEKFDAPHNSRLDEALGILAFPWSDYAWLKVQGVPDPKVDATTKSGDQLSIPCIVKIYESEEEARAEAERELAERESGEEGVVASTTATTATTATPAAPRPELPPVPEAWAGNDEFWLKKVRELKAKYPGPKPVFKEQVERAQEAGMLYDEAACTAGEAVTWFDLV